MTETKTGLQAEGFRLSPAQKHLWTLSSAGGKAFYVCGTLKAKATLEISLLKQAIENVVNTHEILRTALKTHRNFRFPLQIISNRPYFYFEEQDISRLTEAETASFIGKLIDQTADVKKDSAGEFDLLKVFLLKTGEPENVLLIFLPAYFCDRTGFVNLITEISNSYQNLEQHREYESDIPQFADISEWQNENLESEETRNGREFWKDSLQLFLNQQTLPIENKTAELQVFQPAMVEGLIDDGLFKRLKAKSESAGIGLETWLLGCWTAMLFKYLDSSEIVTGVDFDGRDFPELKQTLGNLTKYLPVNAAINPELDFTGLAISLEKSLTDVREWQEGFFWDLLITDESETNTHFFWNYCFNFYDAREILKPEANIFEVINISDVLDRFKLCFGCFLLPETSRLVLKYDSALFSQNQAERLFAQFLKTVSLTTENPQIKLRELNFITDEEKSFVTEEINDTFFDYKESRHFHQLFENRVADSPQSVAVICEDRKITYGELNSKSNQIAESLISKGVKPDDIVGIYLFPTIDFVISLLGVLKAGAGYLPLDPANPLPRLVYMANDAKPKVIITQEKLTGNDLECDYAEIVIDRFAFSEEDAPNPDISIDEENLAYLIYTSGSTGNPKGVVINHRGLKNYLQWCLHSYNLENGDGVPVHSSIGFDLSVTGIMSPLTAGKTTYLLGENSSMSSLIDLIESNNNFSFIKITPSHLEILRLLLSEKSLSAIKLLIIGGEALYGESFENWRGGFSDTLIINEYGPTETVVGCITFEKLAGEIEPGNVPIGKPIRNTEVYLLDERMNPVPTGVAGEMYLGGEGLARGYWQRPGLTAERFVPHPFGKHGERLYRTGDLARYLTDGQIEYLGRADRQVKIRGYRIELGEIEGQVRTCPAVADAVVDVKLDSRGEKQLVCYYVVTDQQTVNASFIQSFLKEKLPDYMIPARYLELEKIPLTGNGKVDRDGLPELSPETAESEMSRKKENSNPVEEILVNIWEEILGVHIHTNKDNFFELGGHSLLATQLISRIRDTFGVELELGVIFDNPQINLLAERIAGRMTSGNNELLPLVAVSKDQPLPLSFAQQRMWFLNQFEGGSGNYNISFPLRVKGNIDIPALEKSIDSIKARHDVLRTTFDVDLDGNLFQKINPEIQPAKIQIIDLSDLEFEKAQENALQIVDEQSRFQFDLSGGELFNPILIKLRDQENVLMITMHHIISDGWSTAIFIRELAAAYRAFLSDTLPDLPALPVQYADYAVWQRNYLSAQVLDTQLEFWKLRLGTANQPLALPTDYPRPPMRTFNGAKQWLELPGDLTAALREVSRSEQATLFMTLMAGFKIFLARTCRQADIAVGIPVANRNRGEVEDLIGFFVNTLVIRSQVTGGWSFADYLAEIRRQTLAAYAHQDIPFEKLVEELRPERDLSRTPMFEVMMVMQNTPQEKLELPGMELSGFGLEQKTAKFDLTLTVDETAEESLVIGMEYNTDLFKAETIDTFLSAFQELLNELVAEPNRKLSQLDFLRNDETFLQLIESGDSQSVISSDTKTFTDTPKWQTANSPYVPTTTENEHKIAEIWSEVLGIGKIGKNDDFFHLGGHSLLVIQVVTRVRNFFKTEISIRSLFEHPKLDDFAEYVESLSEDKDSFENSIPVQENQEYYPLSFGQKRLWFIQQMDAESSTYNVSVTLKLEGTLRINLINQAFSMIVGRHATLRTKFVTLNGIPYQKISPAEPYTIETVDLSLAGKLESIEKIKEQTAERTNQPFDLTEGKLFRAVLLKLSDQESILHLTIHHIASDGLSMNILVKEFSEIYSSLLAHKTPELPDLFITYADYGFWQDKNFKEGKLTEKIDYWKKALGDKPAVLNLPTDKARPRILSGKGGKYQFVFPERLKTKVSDFSKNQDATMFMSVFSAFFVLLSKYAGQDEILAGTPVANRNRIELENLVGFFVNTLVIKADLTDDPTFSDLLERIKNKTLSAFENQDVPFEMLVEEIQPARHINRHPLFQVMFAYQYKTDERLNLPGLKISPLEAEDKNSMFDLTFTVFEAESESGIEIEYSTDLFFPETIARMGEDFQLLLERVLEFPDEKISRISLLGEDERSRKLKLLEPPLKEKENLLFHRMFEEQVQKTPTEIAVIQDDETLTYAELNSRANQLAAFLQSKGVGAEKIVCVYQNRSIRMIISILAVLKAGGAYIPLEPDVPVNRVNTILSDIPSAFVISETPYIDSINAESKNKINPEAESEIVSKLPTDNLQPTVYDENPAYLIYTSGSTGKPKGVTISHRALCNHLLWILEFQPYQQNQKHIISSSLSFDASVWELHKPLICGASTVVINTKQQLDLDYLTGQIRKNNVTVLQTTPTFLKYLLNHPNAEKCKSLEEIFVGGEALTFDLLERFYQTFECRLYNTYGPTETTVEATITYKEPNLEDGKITIGQAVENKYVYVLDENLNLVPDGIPGEIYIGGAGLARGYFNRPGETAENFIPDPYALVPGARIYRTGDFGRYLADGNIEFLGRKDHQVKVNGQRLELSEIEALCLTIPQISQAIVELREKNNRQILVGFLVSQNGEKPPDGEIRSILRKDLPEYMIPAAFQWLDSIPVLPSGKTDRKNLQATALDEDQKSAAYAAPQTDAQKKIVTIWRKVLERENIGLYDNFFDSGGHSLLLIKVLEQINSVFEKNISILDLFMHTTVESLADFLTSETTEDKLAGVKERIEQRQKLSEKNRDIRQKRRSGRNKPEN